MATFWGRLLDDFTDAALESPEGFVVNEETERHCVDITVDVKTNYYTNYKGERTSNKRYVITNVEVFDEELNDVTSRYAHVVELIKEQYLPDYYDIIEQLEEDRMSYDELYFGSTRGYLQYRYGATTWYK